MGRIHVHTRQDPENLRAVEAYLYGGSEYVGWGSCDRPGTGYFFDVPEHAGFGPDQTLARMATGLHFGHRVEEATGASTESGPVKFYYEVGADKDRRIYNSQAPTEDRAKEICSDHGWTFKYAVQV